MIIIIIIIIFIYIYIYIYIFLFMSRVILQETSVDALSHCTLITSGKTRFYWTHFIQTLTRVHSNFSSVFFH
jgi:hypothetical protein